MMMMMTMTRLSYICISPFLRSPHYDESEAIIIHAPPAKDEALAYLYTLLASGFESHPENRKDHYKLLPCPEGTFFNSSSKGAQGCIECPAGITHAAWCHAALKTEKNDGTIQILLENCGKKKTLLENMPGYQKIIYFQFISLKTMLLYPVLAPTALPFPGWLRRTTRVSGYFTV